MADVEPPRPGPAEDLPPAGPVAEIIGLPTEDDGAARSGRRRGIEDSFIGRAAQLAVMAELLRLHCNVAIPEVDLGTDVFVFQDGREGIIRLQVKACTVPRDYADGSGYSAKFSLPMKQFRDLADRPPLYYALAVLRGEKWVDFLVVSWAKLQDHFYSVDRFGSHDKANDHLVITLEFRNEVSCSGRNLTDCRNACNALLTLLSGPDLG